MPREGHDKKPFAADRDDISFQSTCPARGTTPGIMPLYIISSGFQSTCPARGTTEASDGHYETQPFQSTCPARGTTAWHIVAAENLVISIHVPREGHDQCVNCGYIAALISIHVPREGHDVRRLTSMLSTSQFQSTCPARGTTRRLRTMRAVGTHFNPRAPRGARPVVV